MVKSKNIIAGLGVVAGLGMALLPLGAFATDGQLGGVETNPNASRTIRGVVGDVISIELTNDTNEATDAKNAKLSVVDLTPGKLNNSLIHTVKVSTNAQGGFELKMAAADGQTALRYVTEWEADEPGTNQVKASKTLDGTVASIASVTGSGAALADLAADSTAAGAWGYKVAEHPTSGTTDFGTGNYLPIPSSATRITEQAAPTGATGKYEASYDINYGIVPANNQLSGAYEATIIYSAVTKAL